MKKEFIAAGFLFAFLVIIIVGARKNFDVHELREVITSLFHKNEVVGPLPSKDPIRDLEALLRERKIETIGSPIASGSAMFAILASGEIQVFFSTKKDLPLQVSSLQLILNKLTIEGRSAQKIDFRFVDPVVLYWGEI